LNNGNKLLTGIGEVEPSSLVGARVSPCSGQGQIMTVKFGKNYLYLRDEMNCRHITVLLILFFNSVLRITVDDFVPYGPEHGDTRAPTNDSQGHYGFPSFPVVD
jgi:hypothetical protein